MEVDILPLAIPAVPDTGLFGLASTRTALPIDVLCQADVGNAGSIFPNDMYVRVQDSCVNGLVVLR